MAFWESSSHPINKTKGSIVHRYVKDGIIQRERKEIKETHETKAHTYVQFVEQYPDIKMGTKLFFSACPRWVRSLKVRID